MIRASRDDSFSAKGRASHASVPMRGTEPRGMRSLGRAASWRRARRRSVVSTIDDELAAPVNRNREEKE
jgi:hypothetical protein